jgi:transposase
VALPGARAGLTRELRLLQDQLALYTRHIEAPQESMVEVMRQIPEVACPTSIPGVAPVSASVFLGSVGDVRAYRSSRPVLKLAADVAGGGFQRMRHGYDRLSKSGRPLLRRLAFMLGLRAVRSDGLYPGRVSGDACAGRPAENAGGRSHGRADAVPHVRDRAFTPAPPRAVGV